MHKRPEPGHLAMCIVCRNTNVPSVVFVEREATAEEITEAAKRRRDHGFSLHPSGAGAPYFKVNADVPWGPVGSSLVSVYLPYIDSKKWVKVDGGFAPGEKIEDSVYTDPGQIPANSLKHLKLEFE